ncbi:hypothetical protein BS47DRAFT_1351593, partial [Hydnum rufescens UP504]
TPTSLGTEGTVDPKDSPPYSHPIPYHHPRLILTRLCRPIHLHHSLRLPVFALLVCVTHLYEIHMPLLCLLRYIPRPVVLLRLVRMVHGPEVPLIFLTYGIHSRLCCPSHSRLPVFLTIPAYGGVSSVNRRDSRHSARSADSWVGAAISRTSSQARHTEDHLSPESQSPSAWRRSGVPAVPLVPSPFDEGPGE